MGLSKHGADWDYYLTFYRGTLSKFLGSYKIGDGEAVGTDAFENVNAYNVTSSLFHKIYYVIFYSLLKIHKDFSMSAVYPAFRHLL